MTTRMLDRREFLGVAMAAAIASKADAAPADSKGEWRNRAAGMAYRRFGRTGFMVSEVVMGGNLIAPGNSDHVRLALDMGLNYLDTAPAYGNTKSEMGYAEVIRGRKRDTFFLNTKVSAWDMNRSKLYKDIFSSLAEPEQKKLLTTVEDRIRERKVLEADYFCNYFASQEPEVRDATLADVMAAKYGREIDRGKNYRQIILDSFEASLKRLGVDHTDILMCPHGASTPTELTYPEIFEAFETLKKAGKVRYLGVSAHSDPAGILDAAVKSGVYSVAMVAYSIINHPYVGQAVKRAHEADFGVIAMKVARPVNHGRNNGLPNDPRRVKIMEDAMPGPVKLPQKCYLWALRNPGLTAVISEMGTADLVRDNVPLAQAKKPA